MSFNDFRSPWTGSDSAVESFLNRLRVFDSINFNTMLFVLIPAAQILNPFWVFAPNQTRPPKLLRLICVQSTLAIKQHLLRFMAGSLCLNQCPNQCSQCHSHCSMHHPFINHLCNCNLCSQCNIPNIRNIHSLCKLSLGFLHMQQLGGYW